MSLESDLFPTVWSFWKTDVTRVRHLYCRARVPVSTNQSARLTASADSIALADGMLELAVVFPDGENLELVIRLLPLGMAGEGWNVPEKLPLSLGRVVDPSGRNLEFSPGIGTFRPAGAGQNPGWFFRGGVELDGCLGGGSYQRGDRLQ